MFGTAEIQEMSSDDAPVAAIVPIDRNGSKAELRFHSGRFYRPSSAAGFDPGSAGLESEMGRAICDHILGERMWAAAIGPTADEGGWKSTLWSMHGRARLSQFAKAFHQAVPDSVWELTKPFDPTKHDGDLLPKWAEVASSYMSSLIVVDGRLWLPVDEPMMTMRENESRCDDASCYRARTNLPYRLPSPFGTDQGKVGEVGVCHRYWDPRWNYMSLLEAVTHANSSTGWLGDVLMPEAFAIDHAALQLDRAARVCAASINWLTDDRGHHVSLLKGNEWLQYQSSFKRVLKQETQQPSDDIEQLLGNFSRHLAGEAREHVYVSAFVRSTNLPEMIDRARERWNDRPIELGSVGTKDVSRRPSL
ncbi:hypothetical protein HFO56_03125 [Rhizobium laguerreae]|uniref:hypothetical protein n=1 Tax=Rhizobium laguerreae TaxID=1076926 RepID=UPI001C90D44D|nr:hypothetical protein [Rhizobium laguerreae]MBY3151379.1 hypothetical protein [Rhizobium laguerreae]